MTNLPIKSEGPQLGLFLQPPTSGQFRSDTKSAGQLLRLMLRRWWLIAACALGVAAAAGAYVFRLPRVYQATASIRIVDKQPNLPEVFLSLSSESELGTEMEVLRSRSLAEDAVGLLGLQVHVLEPRQTTRSSIISDLSIAREAPAAEYVMDHLSDGRFAVRTSDSSQIGVMAPGQRFRFGGVEFTLSKAAADYPRIRIGVESFDLTLENFSAALAVTQTRREVKMIAVRYEDTDRDLVWQVPNLMVSRFMARRLEARRSEATSTVAFLRKQLDTLSAQLTRAEGALRQFREREQVVSPEVEGSSQVTRLIALQAERGAVEAERAALQGLLAEVTVAAEKQRPGEPSPYRRLLAFPTLLRNAAASEQLRALATVEDQRTELLTRRLPNDPDVEMLSARVRALEEQLRSLATSYLQGLDNQVASTDTVLRGFGQQLARVPGRQLQFARLERQPKILEEMYALLQTRLKEAEIAEAVGDPSIQVVDRAVAPRKPVKPRRFATVIGALVLGLFLGCGAALLIEYVDRSIHTRADVHDATGLAVLGLIPNIRRVGRSAALIAHKASRRPHSPGPPLPPSRSVNSRSAGEPQPGTYTFLAQPSNDARDHLPANQGALPESRATPRQADQVRYMTIAGIGSAVAEAYGSLQTNIAYARLDDPVKLLVFTSAMPGEGKTTTAANLALSLAQLGRRVLLIDADLRRGMVHRLFESNREPGLTTVLQGSTPFEDARQMVQLEEGRALHYLTSGRLPPHPLPVLESEEMRSFLRWAREEYDMVILDSPPVNIITDAALLGVHADGVLLVARAGVTSTPALEFAMEKLGRVSARVLGVVLNGIDFKRDAVYDSAYTYCGYQQHTSEPAN